MLNKTAIHGTLAWLTCLSCLLRFSASMAGAQPASTQQTPPPQTPLYDAVRDRVQLGGYGSLRYETNDLEESNNGFDFRRFVLTLDATPAKRLHFTFELEFERFTALELERKVEAGNGEFEIEQAVEGSNGSELKIEQAWLQYDIVPWLNVRAGALLTPVGRFNLMHDDNRWNLPRRPLVDRGAPVLPVASAWTELGAGLTGEMRLGNQGVLSYELYLVNGVVLDAEVENVARSRDAEPGKFEFEAKFQPVNGPFDKDLNSGKGVAGRINLSPALGYEFAISGYVGEYTPDFLGQSENVWSIAADGMATLGPFEIEGEYVATHWENVEKVAQAFARVIGNSEAEFENDQVETEIAFELANLADTKHGYWLELRYPFWPEALRQTFLSRNFDNPQIVAVARWEQVFFRNLLTELAFVDGSVTSRRTRDATLNRLTLGVTYRPTPLWVLSLAYEWTFTPDDSLEGLTNFLPAQADEDAAHAFLVGIAFGF